MAAPPSNPGQTLALALQGSDALTGLLQRVQQSRARLAAVAPVLPQALQAHIRAGPLDDAHWVLLAPDSAAAAKLRQLLPTLRNALTAAGFEGPAIRIKVLPKS